MQSTQPGLSDEQRAWLEATPLIPETLTLRSPSGTYSTYRILDRDGEGRVHDIGPRMGFKGFVLRVEDQDNGVIYACKLCVPGDYDESRTEFVETRLARDLRGADGLFVVPERCGRVERFEGMPGPQESFVCFISEWVDGRTLESWCKNEDVSMDPESVCTITFEILRGIRFLRAKRLKHDDLHWGNVMFKRQDPALVLLPDDRNELRVRIIDMGSLKEIDQQTVKSKDDDLSLLQIMTHLYNALWRRRSIASNYSQFLTDYRRIIEQLADDDHLRYFATDDSLPRALRTLGESARSPQQPEFARKFKPFEAISAEHLADDGILLDLFENSLPWFAPVKEPKPIVLTGPRGSGKSMLFRYMAAKTHLASESRAREYLSEATSFGVYVSCATHLQNNLMWIARKPGRVIEHSASIATFFQLIILRELLRSLALAFNNDQSRITYGLTESGLDELIGYIQIFFERVIETPRLTSRLRVAHFADDIDRLRVELHVSLINGKNADFILPETFLGEITTKLRACIPRFSKIPVVFLLDDYSSNRVHPDIQSVLNRIIFERRDSHYFKISCEKFGFIPHDIDGVRIDPSREYEEVDAGSYATADISDTKSRTFLARLIDRRLDTAKWRGRADSLIGSSNTLSSDSDLAKFIRDEGSRQGRRYYYYGMEHLARLWSGDIATILQIVKEMFVLGDVNENTEATISMQNQHRAIVSVANAFKEKVIGYHPYGFEMGAILNHFGSMAREILVHGSLDSKDAPRRLYRLEMSKDQTGTILDLIGSRNPDAASLAKELLRRAVFIQHADSRGKEGPATQTVRWELRKIFLPAFGTSLQRSSYVDVKSTDEFIRLLVDSQQFCENIRARYMLGKNQDRKTRSIFGDD